MRSRLAHHVMYPTSHTKHRAKFYSTCSHGNREYVRLHHQNKIVCKTIDVFECFIIAVIMSNTGALIGVHCTHGVNRTGYLICRYLVQKLKWEPESAIAGGYMNQSVILSHFIGQFIANITMANTVI